MELLKITNVYCNKRIVNTIKNNCSLEKFNADFTNTIIKAKESNDKVIININRNGNPSYEKIVTLKLIGIRIINGVKLHYCWATKYYFFKED